MPNANVPPKITDATVQISWSPDGVTTTGAYWGYCTVAAVAYRFATYSSETNDLIATPPAVHPIGEEITNAAFELSDLIDHIYAMPYTGSDSKVLAGLRELNIKLAMARLIERMFTSSEPNLSQVAAFLRTEVAGIVDDLLVGRIIWYAPYGDAVPRARAPVYDTSLGATIYPNAAAASVNPNDDSMFNTGRAPWREDMM